MDYEKKYNEALEQAKGYMDAGSSDLTDVLPEIFPELRESEDERIRQDIFKFIDEQYPEAWKAKKSKMLAWLEEQKENIEKEYVFRPLAGTDITIAAEQAIRRVNEGDRLVLAFNGAYILVRKGCNANKIVDIYDAFIEKQKDASKAIEAVDRIDKYIDDRVVNAHDMKNSHPDKKYYSGWDDALGKISGILQDVYSGEKQKEQKPKPNYCHYGGDPSVERCKYCSAACSARLTEEQKPELVQHPPITYTYPSDASRDERLKAALLALLNSDLLKVKEGGYFTKQDLIDWVERIPTDRPAWSEEDERILKGIIGKIDHDQTYGVSKDEMLNFLKRLS